MHFGQLVKKVAYASNVSGVELAALMGRDPSEIVCMFEQDEWKSGEIIAVSSAMSYDFGKHLFQHSNVECIPSADPLYGKILLTVRYQHGKESMVQAQINKMLVMTKAFRSKEEQDY